MEYDPFIESKLASRNLLEDLMYCKSGHLTFENPNEQNPRTPPCGLLACFPGGDQRWLAFRSHFQMMCPIIPGKGNSDSHGARPVHLTITTIKWIRTSKLSITNCPSAPPLILCRNIMGFEKTQGFPAEHVPVSASGGSSKNPKDWKKGRRKRSP